MQPSPPFTLAAVPPDFLLESYRFHLPEAQIAQAPAEDRSASRLLVLDKESGEVQETVFSRLGDILPEGCLLVVNNSRVVPARVEAQRPSGGKVEFLLLTPPPLLRPLPSGPAFEAEAEALLRPAKKFQVGEFTALAPDLGFTLLEKGEFGRCRVRLRFEGELVQVLERRGHLPLPPYIRRPANAEDARRYQTGFARAEKAGSAAAPTAGLHFTPDLRAALESSGRSFAEVTLYVGYGTFSPVRENDIRRHTMHSEHIEISAETADAVRKAKAEGRPVIAVGTTAARTLEGAFAAQNPNAGEGAFNGQTPFPLAAHKGDSDIFIYPGKKFLVIDGLITNFHLPESSLLMLVSALAGRERVLKAYDYAVEKGFRFFSYGDAMIIV